MTNQFTAEVGSLKLNIELPTLRGVTAYPAEEAHAVTLSVSSHESGGRLVTVHFYLTMTELGDLAALLEIAHRELHNTECARHFNDEPRV